MTDADAPLESAMEQRRVELRMSWRDVSKAADMSYEGLRAIRRGERKPNAISRAKLEDALQWESGSIEAVSAGGQPTPSRPHPADNQPTESTRTISVDELQAMREQVVAMLDRIDGIERGR